MSDKELLMVLLKFHINLASCLSWWQMRSKSKGGYMGKKDVSVAVSGMDVAMSAEIKIEFLRFISAGEKLILDAIDRKEIIANAIVDANYLWKTDECRQATSETEVGVYELIKDATIGQMFSNPEKMCLTQSQIFLFAKKYINWLLTNIETTFFLFKSYNRFFVVCVYVRSDSKLIVHVHRLEYPCMWNAKYRPRLVLPLILPQLV